MMVGLLGFALIGICLVMGYRRAIACAHLSPDRIFRQTALDLSWLIALLVVGIGLVAIATSGLN